MADSDIVIDVEVVRAGFDSFGRGDLSFVEAWIAPDCKWEENHAGGFPGLDPVYVGRDGLAKWLDDTRQAWEAIESEAEDVVAVENSEGPAFVISTRLSARGRQDIEVDWVLFNVLWTHRAKAVVRRRVYFDRDEALSAATLSDSEIEAASRS